MLAQLPMRYRTTTWAVGVITFAAVGAWLTALAVGPVLTAADVALSSIAGAALGVVAVHAFLALLAPVRVGPEQSVTSGPQVG